MWDARTQPLFTKLVLAVNFSGKFPMINSLNWYNRLFFTAQMSTPRIKIAPKNARLHLAYANGSPKFALYFLQHGVRPDAVNARYATSLRFLPVAKKLSVCDYKPELS